MSLEAYTGNISDLVITNPTPTDPKSQGDDHLRGIKYTLKQSFPNFDGPTTQFPGQVTPNEITIGRNADQSKNFKITVPSPEDGTLTIERANGTDVMKFLANGGVDMPSLPFSKASNGYMTLPNGFIVQWGRDTQAAGDVAVAFPIQFPTACFSVSCTMESFASGTQLYSCSVDGVTSGGFNARKRNASGNPAAVSSATEPISWIAIGH